MSTAAKSKSNRISCPEYTGPMVSYVFASDSQLFTHFVDGRQLIVPLDWFPRLSTATAAERNHWELIADGVGIHWPDLDEHLSAEGLAAGKKSGESKKSFDRWLKYYRRGEKVPVPELPLPEWAKI